MYLLRHALIILGLAHNIVSPNKIYYKMMKLSGKKGCVQASVSQTIAHRFGATIGTCAEQKCFEYKGQRVIPFCCSVEGYGC